MEGTCNTGLAVEVTQSIYRALSLSLPTDAASTDPLPVVTQDSRPAVRTISPPHLPAAYDGSPVVHHDLKTSGTSDYAYTFAGST
jgi:hypothetical protein